MADEQVQAEEVELVDPMVKIREDCSNTKECSVLLEKLNTCNDRVNSRSQTTETCSEELFDYLHCVDHCMAPKLFKALK